MVAKYQPDSVARVDDRIGEEHIVSLDRRSGKVAERKRTSAFKEPVVNLGRHLEGQTDRCQRGNDGAIPIYRRAGEEVATFENTDPVVGSHPLLGQLLHIG